VPVNCVLGVVMGFESTLSLSISFMGFSLLAFKALLSAFTLLFEFVVEEEGVVGVTDDLPASTTRDSSMEQVKFTFFSLFTSVIFIILFFFVLINEKKVNWKNYKRIKLKETKNN
jgi:hypothetical protein